MKHQTFKIDDDTIQYDSSSVLRHGTLYAGKAVSMSSTDNDSNTIKLSEEGDPVIGFLQSVSTTGIAVIRCRGFFDAFASRRIALAALPPKQSIITASGDDNATFVRSVGTAGRIIPSDRQAETCAEVVAEVEQLLAELSKEV